MELDEKSSTIKNEKITFDFSVMELSLFNEIVNKRAEEISSQLNETGNEMELVYCKDNFEMISFLNGICEAINEAILLKSHLDVTYEQFDVMWDCLIYAKDMTLREIHKYGRTLMPDTYKKYKLICQIVENNKDIYDMTISRLYPKRAVIIESLNDFFEESSYNGFFIENKNLVTIHIPMREKDTILCGIDNVIFDMEHNHYGAIKVGNLEMPVEIGSEEIKNVLCNIASLLSKDIDSGSIFKISVHDYFVFLYSMGLSL